MNHDEMPEGEKRKSLKDFFDSSLFFRILLALMVLACCLFATAPRKEHEMQKLIVSQLSPINLCADFDFLVEDKARTEASREIASARVPNFYQIRLENSRRILQRSEEFFREVKNRENAERTGQPYKPASGSVPAQWVKELSSSALNFFLRLADNPPRKEKYSALLRRSLQSGVISEDDFEEIITHGKTIRIVDPLQRRSEMNSNNILTPGRCAKQIIAQLLDGGDESESRKISEGAERSLLRILEGGNLVYDKLFTDSQIDVAEKQVPVIHRQIFAGTMILRKGAVLTEDDLNLYNRYVAEKSKRRSTSVWVEILRANVLPCLVLILVLGLYLFYLQKDLLYHNRSLWLLGIILILGMLLNRFFFDGLLVLAENTDYPHSLIYFCLPLGFTAVLISVIFGLRTSLICGLFVSVVAALACPKPFQTLLLGALISCGGSLAVRRTLNYRSFFMNCFWGTALGAMMIVLILLIREQNILQMLWRGLIPLSAVACMGLVTAMLTQMTLILLETFFDLNTTMSLMICCDYNHPLLKEMQMKAPGTYHHCLMVATLAEQAAQDAGLNPVKARACGLFHDIGKIVQPEFFIENNRSGVDMHRDMDPTMSAMIIRSHVVTHGVELARKYKLKRILWDAITQHHGNDLIVYFHKKAQALSPGAHISEKDFRYPCALPSDKEICVVMLSDCCEAASRSLERPTPEALSELICEIFRKKIRAGQLDASNLTMFELSRIRKSFINTLQHMYHGRIAYPKDENQDENDLFVASGKTLQKT